MATPTLWNVRDAPAVTAASAAGMFMLLPVCLYLVAALPLRCFSPVVAATDAATAATAAAAVAAATAARRRRRRYRCRWRWRWHRGRRGSSTPTSYLSGSFHLAFITAKHSCQLKVHRRPIYCQLTLRPSPLRSLPRSHYTLQIRY